MNQSQASRGDGELILFGRMLGDRVCSVTAPDGKSWDPLDVPAVALWDVLSDDALSQDERQLTDSMLGGSERQCTDRLVERRIERALRTAFGVQTSDGESEPPPEVQAVLVREQSSPSADVAGLAPGEPIDELVAHLASRREDVPAGSHANGDLELRLKVGNHQIDLPDGPDDVQIRAGIASLVRHMARVLNSGDVYRQEDELEERDLSGMLLGGKYRVKRIKGKGGFGNVYEAEDEMLGARVALKVLNRRAERSPGAIENFLREAKLLTSIDHENIVRWITFDRTDDGLHYFVMEYLGGEELEEVLQREGRLEPKRAAQILLRVLAALRATHGLDHGSLLHLDLKPENVFVLPAIDRDGAERVKVIDFGISQHVGAEARQVSMPGSGVASSVLEEDPAQTISATVSHEISRFDRDSGVTRVRGGTLLYSSPEQIEHLAGHQQIKQLDGRSDLYSLGIMAYRMLTSRFPFERCDDAKEVIHNHLEVAPKPLGSTGNKIPRKLAAFVDRCLAKDRDARWKDSAEAYEFLDAYVNPPARVGMVAAVAVVVLLMAFGLFQLLSDRPVVRLSLQEPATGGPPQTVSLGVESPPHELVWEKWPAEIKATELALVGTDDQVLPGWKVAVSDETERALSIAVDASSPPLPVQGSIANSLRAHVAVLDEDGDQSVLSLPFSLEFLGSWSMDAAPTVIDHEDARLLDPSGRVLDVVLRGSSSGLSAIERVDLSMNGRLQATSIRPFQVNEGAVHYRLPLDSLAAESGEVDLAITAGDRSGRTQSVTHRLNLAAEPAGFDSSRSGLRRDVGRSGRIPSIKGRHSIDPDCSLTIATTDRAVVSVEVFRDVEEEPLAQGGPYRLDGESVLAVACVDLGLDSNQKPFNGRLVMSLSEGDFVDRVGSIEVHKVYPIDFYPGLPELTVRLAPSGGVNDARVLRADALDYFGWSGAALLTVERSKQARSLLVEVRIQERAEDRWALTEQLSARIDEGSQGRSTKFAFEPQATGLYRIRVRAFDEVEGERGPEVGEVRDFQVIFDTQPPQLTPELAGFDDGGLITPEISPGIDLRVDDATDLVSMSWRLTGPEGVDESGDLELTEESPGKWVATNQPDFWSEPLASGDGDYSLVITSTDIAGNQGSAEMRWTLALDRPEVNLVSPVQSSAIDGTRLWLATRVWNVGALVRDPNSIDRVTARITNLNTMEEHEVRLEPTGEPDVYEIPPLARPLVNPRWSTDPVSIAIEAWDSGGNRGESTRDARLPVIDKVFHAKITRTTDTSDVMVLVPGNDKSQYVAGGKGRKGQRSTRWEVPISLGALQPYYLDQAEVSRSAYLRFVEDPGGYRAPTWWPVGTAPSEDRRQQLARDLRNSPALDDPVTGIRWPEAAAFARSHGKRLPTIVEWEFAVRGGKEDRTPSLPENTKAGATPGISTQQIGAGLSGLTGGVREWSSTPGSFFEHARRPKQHFGAHKSWLLETPEMVASADLDGDGQREHVAALYQENRVEVWFSKTKSMVSLGNAELTPQPRHVVCADVDGDERLDIVTVLADGTTIAFLNSSESFSSDHVNLNCSVSTDACTTFPYRWVVGASAFEETGTFLSRVQRLATETMDDVGFRCAMDAELALDLEQDLVWKEQR